MPNDEVFDYESEVAKSLRTSAQRILGDDFDSPVIDEIAEGLAQVRKEFLEAEDEAHRQMYRDAVASLHAQFDTLIESSLKDAESFWSDTLKAIAATALDLTANLAESAGRVVGGAASGVVFGFLEDVGRKEASGSRDAASGEHDDH